jgi:hypothetical protein
MMFGFAAVLAVVGLLVWLFTVYNTLGVILLIVGLVAMLFLAVSGRVP